jgi:hypothetical protein
MPVRIQEVASRRLDEIFRYARDRWGSERAERCINGIFTAFDGIETHAVMSAISACGFEFALADPPQPADPELPRRY